MTYVDRGKLHDYTDYEHHEDNVNPAMRPGLGKLIFKLHGLSILKDRPDSVQYLIHDLAHYYLIRDTPNPTVLWYTIGELVFMWQHLAGGWEWVHGVGTGGNEDAQLWPNGQRIISDNERHDIVMRTIEHGRQAVEKAWGSGENINRRNREIAEMTIQARIADGWSVFTGESGTYFQKSGEEDVYLVDEMSDSERVYAAGYAAGHTVGYKSGRDAEAAYQGLGEAPAVFGLALGEAPAVIRVTPHNTDVNFKDKSLKLGVAGVIAEHTFIIDDEFGEIFCHCQRTFDSVTAWSIHVRKRIWRYILDVYPTLGSENSEDDRS